MPRERKRSPKRVNRSETVGSRIRGLRENLGYLGRQADFANLLDVGQGTLSAWERNDPVRKPSAIIFLKLAALARSPEEARFFLKQAAIDEQVVFSLADLLGVETRPRSSEGRLVRIRELPGTSDIGGLFVQIPAGADSASFRYFVLEEGCSKLFFKKGEIAIVDVSHGLGSGFCNLWDKIVLAKLPPRYWPSLKGLRLGPSSYSIGVLRLVSMPPLSLTWVAQLDPIDPENLGDGVEIGRWHPDADLDSSGQLPPEIEARLRVEEAYRKNLEGKWEERAGKEMRPHEAVEIIGRVVAWDGMLARR